MPNKINTATMPGDNMSPESIEAAARSMSSVGSRVSTQGGTVLTSWQKISASYQAPEDAVLFHAMDPVKTDAESFGTDVATAASALTTFAEEVRTIKAAVASIRTDAKNFIDSVAGGVEQKTPQVHGETTTITVDWDKDQASVDANNALIRRTNDQQEALWAAERRCANAIYDVIGHAHVEAASESNTQGYGVDQIPDNADMPWGQTVKRTENCGEKVAHGVANGFGAMAGGFASLVGFKYTGTGLWDSWDWSWDWSWSNMGNAWKGVGMFAVGAATLGPGGLGLAALPGPVGGFFRDSQKVATSAVAGLVAIDLYADDPLHKWKEDGWEAVGESIFNVGTLVVAPTKVGNLGKVGRAGEVALKVTDPAYLALRAGQAVKSLSVTTVEGLARLRRVSGELDGAVHVPPVRVEIPSVSREHVTTDVPSTGHPAADAPPARDYHGDNTPGTTTRDEPQVREPGDRPTTNDHTGDSRPTVSDHTPGSQTSGSHEAGSHESGSPGATAPGGHEAPATAHDPSTPTADTRPADHTPVNDPQLAKSDAVVRTQVDQIRSDIGPSLQREADDAWQHAVDRAHQEGIQNPSAQRLGTYAHAEFDHWVESNGRTLVDGGSGYRVRSEASFDRLGQPIDTPEKGSIRPDLVIERRTAGGTWEVVHVVDLKTGNAGIASSWEKAVQGRLQPLYPSETLRPHKVPVTVP